MHDDKATSSNPAERVGMRHLIPDDPMEHSDGNVGVTSRWWYLPGMYHPEAHCGACSKPEQVEEARAGETFLDRMRRERKLKYDAAGLTSARGEAGQSAVRSCIACLVSISLPGTACRAIVSFGLATLRESLS